MVYIVKATVSMIIIAATIRNKGLVLTGVGDGVGAGTGLSALGLINKTAALIRLK
jgi:hypothetical protein